MSYQIELTDEAKLNIAETLDYYINISRSLQERFKIELINTIDRLKDNPQHHQVRYRNIRIAHFKDFPYAVHFFVEEQKTYVLKILHQKRFYK